MKSAASRCAWALVLATAASCGTEGTNGPGEDGDGMPGMVSASPDEGAATEGPNPGMAGMGMGAAGSIRLTARQASLAGVTFAVAERAPLTRTVRAVARVVPDEGGQGVVNTRVSGWVERLFVNETGQMVERGQALFELYAPDLVTAQEDLLLAARLEGLVGGDTLLVSARRRLALWGISDSLVAEIERTGQMRRTLAIHSPFRGNVLEKSVVEGEYVRAGDPLFEIADLSTVWVEPEIFERDIGLVSVGQPALMTLESEPGEVYEGRLSFLYPTVDPVTRTMRVRIEVPNPRGRIRPMMYATVVVEGREPPAVTVPLTAVLPTGDGELAFVVRGAEIVPTDVVTGVRGDSSVTVVDGLVAGDTVVASATFLFDSESSLAAAMAGIMLDMGMGLDMGGMDMGGMDMGGMDMGSRDSSAAPMDGIEMEGADSVVVEPDSGTVRRPDEAGEARP